MEYNKYGVNKSNLDIIDNDIVDFDYEDYLSCHERNVLFGLTLDNRKENRELKKFILKKIKYIMFSYKEKKDVITVKYNNNEYKIQRLSDCIIDLSKDIKKELLSLDRQSKCHIKSTELCYHLDNSKIITGYVNSLNSRYLHSILVIKDDAGMDIVFDWTLNLVIKYDEYKRIQNFEPKYEITHEDVVYDCEDGILNYNLVNLKQYCIFRHELARDFERQKNILIK